MRLESKLNEMGIRSFPPTFHSLKAGAKTEISCFRERYGIQAPKGLTLNDGGMIHKLPDILNFPLIVKGWFYEADIYCCAMKMVFMRTAQRGLLEKRGFPETC